MSSVRYILLLAFAIVFNNSAHSVPAKPGLIKMRQADGTEINVRIMGDENAHYYLSEDGFLLINDNETFYYGNADAAGNIVKSDIKAVPAHKRSAQAKQYLGEVDMTKVLGALQKRDAAKAKARTSRSARKAGPMKNVGLFSDTGFPSQGKQKALVVLVEYTDTKFSVADPYDYFSRMVNENGFSDYGGTGCAAEYFRECSKNSFLPEFDVYGPITLSHNMSYYGGNDWSGNDQHPEEMVIEACQQLDATVDFSEYDRDNDGYIDNVFVFYAGRGEASGGSSSTVWPHSWNITAATYTPYVFDGVRLDRYACSNEWEGSRPDGVGTFIHEFSHVMGLPDLYATSYTSAFTPGAWSAMDYGPYNNNGCTPPLYSAFERYALGWITPRVIDGPAKITLRNISDNEACIIPTNDANEFFLLENRQQQGWDKYIPGHGMLVWHIDFKQSVWDNNEVNNTASHQYVDIEEADGTQNEYSRDGDAFPGTKNVTSFTDDTKPSMKTWSGKKLGLPITDIAETDGIITFNVAGGIVPPDPCVAIEPTDVLSDNFVAHWMPASTEAECTYELSVYTKTTLSGGREVYDYVPGYSRKNVGNATSAIVEGLEPATQYYYVVYVNDGVSLSEASNEIVVTTGNSEFRHNIPVATEGTEVGEASFTANWLPVDGATGYTLNVYTREKGEPVVDICDFTGGVDAIPAGWTTGSRQTYANEAYSGEAIPALRLASDDAHITSKRFDDDIRSLSFWHRGSNEQPDNLLVVSAQGETGDWNTIAEVSIVSAQGGTTTTIDNLPAGTRRVRISYSRTEPKSVAVDDIKIAWGGEVNVADFGTFDAGDALSFVVTGVNAATTYYYTVVATDGQQTTKASNEITVTTAESINTAINTAGRAGGVTLCGNRLTIPAGANVTVTDISGRVIHRSAAAQAAATVTLAANGVYLIKTDTRTAKVVVK